MSQVSDTYRNNKSDQLSMYSGTEKYKLIQGNLM